MFNWNTFPWTDFQNLNLDWVLKKIKSHGEDIATIDNKVDTAMANIYQYIQDNLPSIIQQIASVVIDVTQAGAVGDGVTDDSDAIRNALDMGDILYFPEGTYCFKEVNVTKPVIMFGAGDGSVWQPIRKQVTSNQFYTMATFSDDVYLSDIMIRPADSLVTESGTKYLNEAAIVAEAADHVHLERVSIENVFEAYHVSVATPLFIEFEDRHGMAIYFHNCENVCLHDCRTGDFGGEELIWISQDRIRYNKGTVKISDCVFADRPSTLSGSIVNVLGGTLYFTNNTVRNVNNIYTSGTDGGSLFNLLSNVTIFSDNTFTDCRCGNYLDFVEGYFNKSAYVLCSDNIFEGECATPIKIMAKRATVSGNQFSGAQAFRIMTTTSSWIYTAPDSQQYTIVPYCEDTNTVYTDWDSIEIRDNNFNIVKAPYTLVHPISGTKPANSAAISSQAPANQEAKYNLFVVDDNTFVYNTDIGDGYSPFNVITFFNYSYRTMITNNRFIGAGESFPAYTAGGVTYRAVISGANAQDELIVNGNIVDASGLDASEAIAIVTGGSGFRTGTNYYMAYDSGYGAVLDHSGLVSSLGSFRSNYMDNITAGA